MKIKTFLDLCSGIGGGRLDIEKAGLKSIGYSDTSKLAVCTYTLQPISIEKPPLQFYPQCFHNLCL